MLLYLGPLPDVQGLVFEDLVINSAIIPFRQQGFQFSSSQDFVAAPSAVELMPRQLRLFKTFQSGSTGQASGQESAQESGL
jgi:hypothetical protein